MSDFDVIVDNFFKNYRDRGMVKWQGFFLSDHTQNIEKMKYDDNHHEVHRPDQDLDKISELLMTAFTTRAAVNVQLKQMDHNGNYFDSLNGFISGYQDTDVFIDNKPVGLEEISSVEFIS